MELRASLELKRNNSIQKQYPNNGYTTMVNMKPMLFASMIVHLNP